MEHYAGLDISLELTSVCIVDAQGEIIRETKVPSHPEDLVRHLPVVGAVSASGCVSPRGYSGVYSGSVVRSGCNPSAQIGRFMIIPKPRLSAVDRASGFITTPLKYLSTEFDGPHAWERTGCIAIGFGRPVREAQHSTDGLYTVDVSITELRIGDLLVPPGRYVRLEVIPGTAAHRSLEHRRPEPSDLIIFKGPLIWDKDRDAYHPFGHMEVHPFQVDWVCNTTSVRTAGPRPASRTQHQSEPRFT